MVVGAHGLVGSLLPGGRYSSGLEGQADDVVLEERMLTGSPEEVRRIAFAFMRRIHDAYGAPNLTAEAYETSLAAH